MKIVTGVPKLTHPRKHKIVVGRQT